MYSLGIDFKKWSGGATKLYTPSEIHGKEK